MSSNQFNNNASNKVVINFNNQPTNFDDATIPNLPVQDVPIIETPRIAEAAQTSTLQAPVTPQSVSPMPQSQYQGQPAPTQQPSVNTAEPSAEPEQKGGWFSRMKQGLSKSRKNLTEGLTNILIGGKEIDDELLEEVEDQLLVADIGVNATNRIIKNLTEATARGDLIYSHSLYKALQKELTDILTPKVAPLVVDASTKPFVILVVGVNGVGKTTTIGKLAKRLQAEGKSVMLAAGDTFRAAATEQLQVWGERNNIPVVAQGHGSDSASVIFDAIQSAKARGIDVLIADTAGRLQNKTNLMEELKKVIRVMQKADPTAPHESMIVLDAGTGQNALNQVEIFNEAVPLTGVTVTKLDGTAKGGVVFNIAENTNVPIRFIGVGEKIDDLRPFHANDFVKALFEKDE
ncbi:signal recognition particle-docking protein FtsY [Moraxella sp. 179-F 1C4 NHS]